jgi:Transcription antiterminator
MQNFNQYENWYCVFVVTGDEDKVKDRIAYRLFGDFKVIVPKRRLRIRRGGIWKLETSVLFPGYVLINGEVNTEVYYKLKNIPSMLKLLRTGDCITNIDNKEISILSRLMCNNEEIGISNIIMENGKVKVVDGPLFSLEGLVVSVDQRKGRAKVRLNFLGEERIVDLGVTVLRSALN